jgi:hypothetical protein
MRNIGSPSSSQTASSLWGARLSSLILRELRSASSGPMLQYVVLANLPES